ncbi:MAG: pyruvate kinase [Rubrivivax sp.]|nr:pyruvate kinase [Rubrivivax sp.]
MKPKRESGPGEEWDAAACEGLIRELWDLRKSMLDNQARVEPWRRQADASHAASAVNLAHYLALRRHDLRQLQERLARMGLSSLGRAETHVMANLDKVLGILHRLTGRPWSALSHEEPTGFNSGPERLERHAQALFGKAPKERGVRIMVTLPSAASHDDAFVNDLVAAGMDIARINCAHDGAAEWAAMARNVRRAARKFERPVRVLMDLGGPKLRTGAIAGSQDVVKLKPAKDALGRVTAPARLGLRPHGSAAEVSGADFCVGVDGAWLAGLDDGARIDLADARQAQRHLTVLECQAGGVLVECRQTAYITTDTVLCQRRKREDDRQTRITEIPARSGALLLHRGDMLNVLPDGLGHGPLAAHKGRHAEAAAIACTLPEALTQVRKGERIWFDDGRIGGIVRRQAGGRLEVEITHARDAGEKLLADKGINLPDTRLELPALTTKDLDDLEVVAQCADMVGLSFAQSAADVGLLRQRLVDLDAAHLGLVIKIETQRGFEHLPEMLLAAMASPATGVMIARGDLAVECGYERLAEIQEEILWACEAAHVPVVWATQVLETLAKTGLPSRAEITDAAMSERAECVMLNKGPHILDAMRTLDDILRRMQSHQSKKRPLLRALKAWASLPEPAVEVTAHHPSQARIPSATAANRDHRDLAASR